MIFFKCLWQRDKHKALFQTKTVQVIHFSLSIILVISAKNIRTDLMAECKPVKIDQVQLVLTSVSCPVQVVLLRKTLSVRLWVFVQSGAMLHINAECFLLKWPTQRVWFCIYGKHTISNCTSWFSIIFRIPSWATIWTCVRRALR